LQKFILFVKPEFAPPFLKFFGVQNLFFKKGFASPSSPINPNLSTIKSRADAYRCIGSFGSYFIFFTVFIKFCKAEAAV